MKDKIKVKFPKKVKNKKGSFKLRRAERINASAFEGLSLEQVEERKKKNLINKKPLDKTKSYTKIFLQNIFNFCNTLIIVLCLILIIMGHWDYTISSLIIFINIGIGIYQEIKAKRTVQKMSLVKQSQCEVVRGGNTYSINSEEIVLDDIFILSAGQQIPVDGIILDGSIEVDESILTGESEGVKKSKESKILSGSYVLSGEAAARAEKVGNDCYIESISSTAKKITKPESKLFDSIDKIIKIFSCILLVLAIFLFISYRVAQKSWDETMLMTISSMLGMIPCGMFLVTSTALAQSVLKLAKQNALPQDIYSVEMLAMVDTLLLDKTGTITDGNLEVLEYTSITDDEIDFKDIIVSLDDANKDKKPTAAALNKYCQDGKVLEYNDALAFSSVRKYSAITIDNNTYILGAPDFICPENEKVAYICNEAALEGKRTILLARFDGDIDSIDINKTIPIGIFIMQEELNEDVKEILTWYKNNDVDIKIISGDNPVTVSAIAKEAGIANPDKYIDASDLKEEQDYYNAVENYTVFGRVTPPQKRFLIKAIKEHGKTVAMTGDGVNDVLALKDADCSVAMASGSDAASNASQLVLLDSDFSRMPNVVMEGRRVVNNIQRTASLFIVKNIFSMLLAVFSVILMLDYPLEPSQVSLISMFTIGIPSFVLALEPNKSLISGHFLINVMVKAFPAGLTDFLAVSGLVIFCREFGVDSDCLSTSCTILVAIVGFMILYRIARPLKKAYIFMMIALVCGWLYCMLFISHLFAITSISRQCAMLMVVFAIATEPVLRYLSIIVEWIYKKMKKNVHVS